MHRNVTTDRVSNMTFSKVYNMFGGIYKALDMSDLPPYTPPDRVPIEVTKQHEKGYNTSDVSDVTLVREMDAFTQMVGND